MQNQNMQIDLFPDYGPVDSTGKTKFSKPTFTTTTNMLNNWNQLIFQLRINIAECEKYLSMTKMLINELENERQKVINAN